MTQISSAVLERAAALLDADPGYRLTRALPPLEALVLPEPEGRVRTALVIDTETTSLDWQTGRIIQVAACRVRFDRAGGGDRYDPQLAGRPGRAA